jgi:hypothetical protein
VRVAAGELRGTKPTERAEERARQGNFLWAQLGLLGRSKLYGEYDSVSMATVLAGLEEVTPPDDGRSLSQRRADGLVELASHRCDDEPVPHDADAGDAGDDDEGGDGGDAGDDDEGGDGGDAGAAEAGPRRTRHRRLRQGKPLFSVVLDWRDITATAAGVLEINAPGCLPTISAALVEALAGDAMVQAVIVDGARPLTVSRKVWAQALPADVRRAVKLRDRRDRFPGSRQPIEHVHHLDRDGEGHNVDHLVGLSNASHKRVHRHQWSIRLDTTTGEMTFKRGDRTWIRLPHGTRLRRPPPRGPDDADG